MKAAPLVALALAGCAAPARMEDANALAAAETAFAAHSVREDMRAAFMANFAQDGVMVGDGWVRAREYLAPLPAPPIVLEWRPAHVEVAASGEFGLSTGPWKRTPRGKPGAAPAYGQFVSIWQRAPGQPWRVLVDLGVGNPGPALADAPLEVSVARSVRAAMPLAQAEERFQQLGRVDPRGAYQAFGARDLRLYRDGAVPATTLQASLASVSAESATAWRIEDLRTAASGDFGFARGSVASAPQQPPRGYFLRVWRHEPQGWRIALDVVQPAPRR